MHRIWGLGTINLLPVDISYKRKIKNVANKPPPAILLFMVESNGRLIHHKIASIDFKDSAELLPSFAHRQ
jgi:hypothetical protein